MTRLPDGLTWLKSTRSDFGENYLEAAFLPYGGVVLRESEDPDGPTLIYTSAEWNAFVDGVKDGEFDLPAAQQ